MTFRNIRRKGSLQGGEQEKDFLGIKDPSRRALEAVSTKDGSAIGDSGNVAAGCDGDLMMSLWATQVINGPYRNRRGLFWRA